VSVEGTIAAVVMVIVGVAWLPLPIMRRNSSLNARELTHQKQRAVLLTAYERTLASIRDLDEDHLTGKLIQSDYEVERTYWAEQGVSILQELEKHGMKKTKRHPNETEHSKSVPVEQVDPDAQLNDAVEQAIAAYIKSTH
jgi:hypothetical protein